MARFLPVLLVFILLDVGSSSCPDGSVHISLSGNQWSCFKFVDLAKEFFLADLDCQQQNGHLVSIHNGFENLYIAEYADSTFDTEDRYWIGVNSLKANVWTYNDDGSTVTFSDWAPGQPAVNASQQGCASANSQGYWYSDDCFAAKYYVCELPNGGGPMQTTTSPQPTISSKATTTMTSTTTTMYLPPATVCRSYIPFAYDVSAQLTAAKFASMKSFILDPFLAGLFPLDVQPSKFGTYDVDAYIGRRQANVTDISSDVGGAIQRNVGQSVFLLPLIGLVDAGVFTYDGRFPVNTVIFAGSSLSDDDMFQTQNYADICTSGVNTLSVVLMNPNIDSTNYRRISGLNVITWTDSYSTINQLRSYMSCA